MKQIQTYEHTVQYYETDQMGIVHHSNYIRWFEEARTDMMRQAGIGYGRMEEKGIISPVLHISADYRSMVHFEDVVAIKMSIAKFNGITLQISYTVADKETKEVRCTGESRHCFLKSDGVPMSLKKEHREIYDVFVGLMNTDM